LFYKAKANYETEKQKASAEYDVVRTEGKSFLAEW
jgi:hypothetical protein